MLADPENNLFCSLSRWTPQQSRHLTFPIGQSLEQRPGQDRAGHDVVPVTAVRKVTITAC